MSGYDPKVSGWWSDVDEYPPSAIGALHQQAHFEDIERGWRLREAALHALAASLAGRTILKAEMIDDQRVRLSLDDGRVILFTGDDFGGAALGFEEGDASLGFEDDEFE